MKIIKYSIFCICLLFSLNSFVICNEDDTYSVKSLLLVDEPLNQVLSILENLTGKAVLCDQSLSNIKIDLSITHQLSKEDTIRALENILIMNGVAIIDREDGFLRAVSMRSVATHAPKWIEDSTLLLPVSDKICTKLFTLTHVQVSEFSKLIRQILSSSMSTAIPFEDSNSLLVTDQLSNLQRLEKLLSLIDKPKFSQIESKIFRIKHGNAENIASVLKKLILNKGEDKDIKKNENLKNANVLNNVQPAMPGQQSFTYDVSILQNDFRFSRNVSIEHDEYSNSVIVCGSRQDIQHIERIINEIDVLLDQVRIEVVIAQVTLVDNQTSGLESLGISYNTTFNVDKNNAAFDGNNRVNFHGTGASNNRVGSGFHVSGTLNDFSLAYVFNKAKSCDNITVLSAPTIVTTHNREASIKVGESRPVITANFTDLQNEKSIRNSVNYKDIGIELTVTPLIGQNGVIQMKIDQLIQKINGEVEVDGNKQPIISKRQAVSFVSVHDGDVVVLAGLQEKESIDTEGKLWLLGYVPIIGDMLFSPKTKSEQTNELIIFIRPSIVTNPSNEDDYYQKFISESIIKDDVESYERDKKFLKSKINSMSDEQVIQKSRGSKFRKRIM